MALDLGKIKDFRDLSPERLEAAVLGLGVPKYRCAQILEWLFGGSRRATCSRFEEMVNLPQEMRLALAQDFSLNEPVVVDKREDPDTTTKFLLRLQDGQTVETVLIPETVKLGQDAPRPWRKTLCLSSQVGCAMGCRFCFTATMGLKRNMTQAEILGQVIVVQRYLRAHDPEARIRNLVFMGMGEPLHNYANVRGAIEWLCHPKAFGFSKKRITVSTSGLLPEIQRLLNETEVRLAVSLNASDGKVRAEIMPISQKYTLDALLQLCRDLNLPRDERITFEYVLLDGVNDSRKDAARLVSLMHGVRAKINLLAFNEFPGSPFKRPPDERVQEFAEYLREKSLQVNIRKSRGRKVLAACGQLRSQYGQTQNVALE